MDLELPKKSRCLLCGSETVALEQNNSGNPYFTCQTFKATVNLRPSQGDADTAESVLSEAVESAGETGLAEPEGSDDDTDDDAQASQSEQTLEELLQNNE
jgi:hypothetical protein